MISRRQLTSFLAAALTIPLVTFSLVGCDQPLPEVAIVEQCVATVDGTSWHLDPDQANNAAVIAAISVQRDLPAHSASVALATALQESSLQNIDYGDRDSLGLFQQRPSQGWGTPEQILDPAYATGKFYDHLVQVPDWENLPITEAAQAVQRSAYPDAYAKHEGRARAWASGLTGWSDQAISCTLDDPVAAGSTTEVVTRIQRDFGAGPQVTSTGSTVTVDVTAWRAADQTPYLVQAVSQWAVSSASDQQIVTVQAGDQQWERATGVWQEAETALPAGQVEVAVADTTS